MIKMFLARFLRQSFIDVIYEQFESCIFALIGLIAGPINLPLMCPVPARAYQHVHQTGWRHSANTDTKLLI